MVPDSFDFAFRVTIQPLPDPRSVLGFSGIAYDDHYNYNGNSYRTFFYSMPSSTDQFLSDYIGIISAAGYLSRQISLEGYNTLEIYLQNEDQIPAYLLLNYQNYMLLMVPDGIEFYFNGSDAVPTSTPTPYQQPSPTPYPTIYFSPTPEKMKVNVGDIVNFGYYEQDNRRDKPEIIQWVVLAAERDRAMVVSLYALDAIPFNKSGNSSDWNSSSIRNWLNVNFYNTAFGEKDKEKILQIDSDKVSLLDVKQVEKYFKSESLRECNVTVYGKANGAYAFDSDNTAWWWLKTAGQNKGCAAVVSSYGSVYEAGSNVIRDDVTVRPVIWLDLTKGAIEPSLLPTNVTTERPTSIPKPTSTPKPSSTPTPLGDTDFVIDSNGVLKDYKGSKSNVVIPSTVKSIGKGAFFDNKTIRSVEIPYGVTTIGYSAFNGCDNLSTVSLPNSLTSIEEYAFAHCVNIQSIILPSNLTTIGESAFWGCSSITSITIPDKIKEISESVFYKCTNLRTVILPSGLRSIGSSSFGRCSNLSSITLPYGLQSIGDYAFANCSRISILNIPSTVNHIGLIPFILDGGKEIPIKVSPNSYADRWCKENMNKENCRY